MHYFNKVNYPVVSGAQKAVLRNSDSVVVPVPFVMSKGSIQWNSDFGAAGQIADISAFMAEFNITSITEVKYGQLLQALGLVDGDQITVITVNTEPRNFQSPNGKVTQSANFMSYARYILQTSDFNNKAFVKVDQSTEIYEFNPAILSVDSQMNNLASIVVSADGKISIDVDEDVQSLYTAIISRRNNDKWLRSNASLFITNVGSDTEYKIDKVLPSYRPSDEPYLNGAEK